MCCTCGMLLPFLSALHLFCFVTVGPDTIPCQLMIGFFAYAKSFEIDVDKEELEGMFLRLRYNTFVTCFDQFDVFVFGCRRCSMA